MKKQIVPPDLLEEVFELNMQLEELRVNQKMGEDDPALAKDLEVSQSALREEVRRVGGGTEESLGALGSGTDLDSAQSVAPRWTAWSTCSIVEATSETWYGT